MPNHPLPDCAFDADKVKAHTFAKETNLPPPEREMAHTLVKAASRSKPWPFHQRDLSKTIEVLIQNMNEITHTDTAMITSNMLESLIPVIAAIEKMETLIQANKEAMQTGNRDVSVGETPAEVRDASVALANTLRDNYRKIKMASDRFGDLVNYYSTIERAAVMNAHVKSTFRIFGD